MKNKKLVTLIACIGVVGCTIGGSLAWLTTESKDIVNTFTVGDINIELTETGMAENTDDGENILGYTKSYTFVPGDTLLKDPTVTVKAGSEASWLFIRVQEANNSVTVDGVTADPIIIWDVVESDADWIQVPGQTEYWYREVDAVPVTDTDGVSYTILTAGTNDGDTTTKEENGHVTISGDVTKAMVESINTANPTLTFTAAAVQKDNISNVADAFAKLPAEFTN